MNWEEVRSYYPIVRNNFYFQSASVSPLPQPVLDELIYRYTLLSQEGYLTWPQDTKAQEDFKELIGTLLHTSGKNIAIVANASGANSLLALSLKNKFGTNFNVVSQRDEFPSNTIPFQYQKIPMKIVEPDNYRYPIDKILSTIDSNTKAVITSYVQYCTGFRQDLETLGAELKKRSILFFVNATQGFPYFPVDVQKAKIDALVCSVHKWSGCGFAGTLFYTSEKFRQEFPNPFAGWISTKPYETEVCYTPNDGQFEALNDAKTYELGTQNPYSILALKKAYEFFLSIGFERIQSRLLELTKILIEELKSTPFEIISPHQTDFERSAIVTIRYKNLTRELVQFLIENNCIVTFRNGNCRMDVNIFTNESDLSYLLGKLKKFQELN